MAEFPVPAMQLKTLVLGPWVIGGFADLLLQGMLYPMFITYFTNYQDDLLLIKLAVGGLAILTTLKSIHICAAIWIQHVIYFDDLQGAIYLAYTKWWATGSGLMVALIGLYVQIFFLNRLRLLSESWLVVIPIAFILVFAFIAIIVATIFITYQVNKPIAQWFALHLSAVFAGDLLITCSMAYFLIKTKKNVLPQTVGVIQSLLRLTFLTAAPAAICAMINLILSQVYPGTENLMTTAFNTALPKLYALSMMYTLNMRKNLRFGSGRSQEFSGSTGISVRRPTNAQRTDVERSLTNGISVHTETHDHIDMRTMFNHGGSDDKKSRNETFFEAK